MKINWLWDSHLSEAEVRKIVKDENNPKFNIYVQKLFSRVNDPKIAFDIIDEITFGESGWGSDDLTSYYNDAKTKLGWTD